MRPMCNDLQLVYQVVLISLSVIKIFFRLNFHMQLTSFPGTLRLEWEQPHDAPSSHMMGAVTRQERSHDVNSHMTVGGAT